MQLRALIVDDEKHARENLRMLLEEFCPEIKVVGDASGVDEACELVQQIDPHVVFLDIRMPSGSEGFDFIARTGDHNFQVVFVTAFKDYAIQAFNANAIHYILKPVDIDDLREAAAKLLEYHRTLSEIDGSLPLYNESLARLSENMLSGKRARKITLHHSRGFKVVDLDDLVHLESDGNCTRLHFADGSDFLDTRHLKIYEDMLDPERFLRVHRSHLIALDKLSEYSNVDGHTALLKNGKSVPIARARLSEFLQRVRQL